jgi:tetratricopeptide (TPR) repeat protein
LGAVRERQGDLAGAADAYRRAADHGHDGAAARLEALQRDEDKVDGDEAPAPAAKDRKARRATTGASLRAVPPAGPSSGSEAEPTGPHENDGRAGQERAAVPATDLGVLLEQRGDLEAAEEAYRRGDDRGDATAAFNLGGLLMERGDIEGAEEAFRRADERGHSGGASNLGVLLEKRGDLEGAEQAYRRADDRGEANAAFNLGGLLAERGDLEGAEEAFRRADERGDANAAFNLGVLLEQRDDARGAEAAYLRAADRAPGELAEKARVALSDLHASANRGAKS